MHTINATFEPVFAVDSDAGVCGAASATGASGCALAVGSLGSGVGTAGSSAKARRPLLPSATLTAVPSQRGAIAAVAVFVTLDCFATV